MEQNLKYHRILLKLSGEALAGQERFGIDRVAPRKSPIG